MTALAFSALYLLSDVIEAIQGGFSGGQLGLTLIAEAAIPIFVIGLYLVQRPQIGRLGRLSAAAYAYSYGFFTGICAGGRDRRLQRTPAETVETPASAAQ